MVKPDWTDEDQRKLDEDYREATKAAVGMHHANKMFELRDEFAIAALQGLLSGALAAPVEGCGDIDISKISAELYASTAYKIAEEMIKAKYRPASGEVQS